MKYIIILILIISISFSKETALWEQSDIIVYDILTTKDEINKLIKSHQKQYKKNRMGFKQYAKITNAKIRYNEKDKNLAISKLYKQKQLSARKIKQLFRKKYSPKYYIVNNYLIIINSEPSLIYNYNEIITETIHDDTVIYFSNSKPIDSYYDAKRICKIHNSTLLSANKLKEYCNSSSKLRLNLFSYYYTEDTHDFFPRTYVPIFIDFPTCYKRVNANNESKKANIICLKNKPKNKKHVKSETTKGNKKITQNEKKSLQEISDILKMMKTN